MSAVCPREIITESVTMLRSRGESCGRFHRPSNTVFAVYRANAGDTDFKSATDDACSILPLPLIDAQAQTKSDALSAAINAGRRRTRLWLAVLLIADRLEVLLVRHLLEPIDVLAVERFLNCDVSHRG